MKIPCIYVMWFFRFFGQGKIDESIM
jgi:hypothetical protein